MAQKTVGIIQPNYIPWKGYFDFINSVDEFILFDDVQYTRRDWRNRNLIKTPSGLTWLTIPVEIKGKYHQKVCETKISDPIWARKHWASIMHNYKQAPCYPLYRDRLEGLYKKATDYPMLNDVCRLFIDAFCEILDIRTPIRWASDMGIEEEDPSVRLLALTKAVGGNRYLSGPAAKAYMNEPLFADEGIELDYFSYQGYPDYPQMQAPFEHGVSLLDLLLNTGEEAPSYMLSFSGARDGSAA